MPTDTLRQRALDLAAAVEMFNDWDASSDHPKTAEVEFDGVWKLVVVWEDGYRTIKIHQRLADG